MQFSTLDFSIQPYIEGVNPPVTKPNPAFLEDIGEEGMRELLDRFYMKLFESPIKHLFLEERCYEGGRAEFGRFFYTDLRGSQIFQ